MPLPTGAFNVTAAVLGKREYEVNAVLLMVSVATNETVLSANPAGGELVTMLEHVEDQRCTSPAVAAIYVTVGDTQLASMISDVTTREILSVSVPTDVEQPLSEYIVIDF
jgi:hypothetical protein